MTQRHMGNRVRMREGACSRSRLHARITETVEQCYCLTTLATHRSADWKNRLSVTAFHLNLEYCSCSLQIVLTYPLDLDVRLFSLSYQGSGDFWAQPVKNPPLHNFYRFFQDLTGCKLVVIHLDRPISYIFLQVPANFLFIVMTTGQELGHW